jgi:hypothetical protein
LQETVKAIASNQMISWFYQRYRENSLELSPDFQRNPVWLQQQKEYLIETILLELPIPEIYMVNRVMPTGESTYIIVDGQQRLRTIIEFLTEELVIKKRLNSFSGVKSFRDLGDQEKQRFFRYPLVVRDLEDSGDDEIRNLFQRLNKFSVTLNEQELRNAKFKGYFLKTVESLANDNFWVTSGLFSPNDFRRMIDLEFISILLSTMIGGIYDRRERLDEFYLMYEEEFDESTYYVERFRSIVRIIERVIPNIKGTRWSNKGEFYTLFLVLDEMNQLDLNSEQIAQLSNALMTFQNHIFEARSDRGTVEKQYIDYLNFITSGTNAKEIRVRRNKILREYLEQEAELALVPNQISGEDPNIVPHE